MWVLFRAVSSISLLTRLGLSRLPGMRSMLKPLKREDPWGSPAETTRAAPAGGQRGGPRGRSGRQPLCARMKPEAGAGNRRARGTGGPAATREAPLPV